MEYRVAVYQRQAFFVAVVSQDTSCRMQGMHGMAEVHVRRCQMGEITALEGTVCDECADTQFSYSSNKTVCDLCPSNAACQGRSIMYSVEGFWHSAANAALMHACPNTDACKYVQLLAHTALPCPHCSMLQHAYQS